MDGSGRNAHRRTSSMYVNLWTISLLAYNFEQQQQQKNRDTSPTPTVRRSFVRTFIRCGALLNHRNNCCHHLYNNAGVEMTLHWLVNRQRQTPPEKRQSSASAMLTRTSAVFD